MNPSEVPPWHALDAERDLAGAAVSSATSASFVAGSVDLADVYDPRMRRVIEAAIALPDDPNVDLTRFDDGVIIGPNIVVHGMAITGTPLVRIVAIATALDDSVSGIAALEASLPCQPSRRWIERLAAEVADASERRAAMAVLDAARRLLLEGVPVVEIPALALSGMAVADDLDPVRAGEVLRRTAA